MAKKKTGGPRGRPRKPTHLKLLEGNRGKRNLKDRHEPEPRAKAPPCPRQLDYEARKEWKRAAKELLVLGILTSVDRAALAAYCQAWSTYVTALDHLRSEPMIFKTEKGYPVRNPWFDIASTAQAHMKSFMTEFGLTPASRSRLNIAPPPEPGKPKDPAEAYF